MSLPRFCFRCLSTYSPAQAVVCALCHTEVCQQCSAAATWYTTLQRTDGFSAVVQLCVGCVGTQPHCYPQAHRGLSCCGWRDAAGQVHGTKVMGYDKPGRCGFFGGRFYCDHAQDPPFLWRTYQCSNVLSYTVKGQAVRCQAIFCRYCQPSSKRDPNQPHLCRECHLQSQRRELEVRTPPPTGERRAKRRRIA